MKGDYIISFSNIKDIQQVEKEILKLNKKLNKKINKLHVFLNGFLFEINKNIKKTELVCRYRLISQKKHYSKFCSKCCVNCQYLMKNPFTHEYDCPIIQFDSIKEMPNFVCDQWKNRIQNLL